MSKSFRLHLINKSKRLIKNSGLVLLLCMVLSFAVAGCTKTEDPSKTTIRFVTWKPNIPEAWNGILETFHSENPDIQVIRETDPL